MSAVSEVFTAVRKLDLQVAPALVGRDDDTFGLPAKRFGVLDDHRCSWREVSDGTGLLVEVDLVVILLTASLELSILSVDGLIC